jgi:hypothetical protein
MRGRARRRTAPAITAMGARPRGRRQQGAPRRAWHRRRRRVSRRRADRRSPWRARRCSRASQVATARSSCSRWRRLGRFTIHRRSGRRSEMSWGRIWPGCSVLTTRPAGLTTFRILTMVREGMLAPWPHGYARVARAVTVRRRRRDHDLAAGETGCSGRQALVRFRGRVRRRGGCRRARRGRAGGRGRPGRDRGCCACR